MAKEKAGACRSGGGGTQRVGRVQRAVASASGFLEEETQGKAAGLRLTLSYGSQPTYLST